MFDEKLREVARQLKAGKKSEAFVLLTDFLKTNPQSADAWYLMAHVANKPEKKIEALERALQFEPDHGPARELLSKLRSEYQPSAFRVTLLPDDAGKRPSKRSGLFTALTGLLVVLVLTLTIGIVFLSTRGPAATSSTPIVAERTLTSIPSVDDTLIPTSTTVTEQASTATPEIALVSSPTPTNMPPTVGRKTLPPSWTPTITTQTVNANATGGAATQSGPGKWKYLERGSSIGPAATGLVLPAESKVGSAIPNLFLRCRENVFEIYVFAGLQVARNYGAHQTTVRVKFDKGGFQTFEPQVSVKGDAFFFDSAQTFLQQLLAHNLMAVQFTSSASGSVGTTFDLRGLRGRLSTLSCVKR